MAFIYLFIIQRGSLLMKASKTAEVASIWEVDREATPLKNVCNNFYKELKTDNITQKLSYALHP